MGECGTGKTALVRYMAEELGQLLLVKRTSDSQARTDYLDESEMTPEFIIKKTL